MYGKTFVKFIKILKVMLESLDLCQVVEATKTVKEFSNFDASVLLLGFYDSMMKETGNKKVFQGLKNRLIKRNLKKIGLC